MKNDNRHEHLVASFYCANVGVHTYLGFAIVGVCCINLFCDFIFTHSLQFEAAARAQAAANPNLRHISPLGPAQMLAIAQSREREVQQEKERTMALIQYQEALMRAGQPPLQSGPMAVAGNYFPCKITYYSRLNRSLWSNLLNR